MLGNSTLKNYFNSTGVADIKPRAFLEWNANVVSSPYIHGTGNYITQVGALNQLTLQPFQSSPPPTVVSRGQSSAVFNDSNCQLLISGNSSLSAIVTHKQAASGIVTLTTRTAHNISVGSEVYITGVGPENFDGTFLTISGTSNSTIRYDTSNPTFNLARTELKPSGSASSYINSYYADKNITSNSGVKFFLKLKSDYDFQSDTDPSFMEEFNVTLTAIGMSQNEYVYTQVVTKKLTVNASNWSSETVSFANPDTLVDKVRLFVQFDSTPGQKAGLLVDELISVQVSDYEVYVQDRTPVSEIFDGWRPGEPIVDNPSSIPNITINDTETFPQQCTPIHMASQYAVGEKYEAVQRSVTPYAGNPYNYYVSGSSSDSKIIWAIYDMPFATNKIVIKTNTIASRPLTYSIKLLINGTWSNVVINGSAQFNQNGVLTLYYNGTNWSTTRWANSSMPKISTQTGTISQKIDIQGIYFECSAIEYRNPSSPLNGSGVYAAINILEMIELSPRLELDLSDFILEISVNKEMSNTDLIPLPVGSVSSNSADITFSSMNITSSEPDGFNLLENNDISIFTNYSNTSPLKGLIIGGTKVKASFDVDITNSGVGVNSSKINIPAFYMYIDRWSDASLSLDSTSVAECFDSVKDLQNILSRPVYLENKTVNEIIQSVLDPVGFADYSFEELKSLRNIKKKLTGSSSATNFSTSVPYFWTDKKTSVAETLNEIFKPYQIGMYIDEYGFARFTSLIKINEDRLKYINGTSTDLLRVQDFSDGLSNSNIIAMDIKEETPIKKITINYKQPRPHLSDPFVPKKFENGVRVRVAPDVVWEPEGDLEVLPYFELASPGIVTETQTRIPYNAMVEMKSFARTIDYSGYLLIDQEIIKYDGKEIAFTVSNDPSFIRIETIRSKADIDSIISDISAKKNSSKITYAPTGFLINVERGQFGTTPAKHPVLSTGRIFDWSAKEFNAKFESVSDVSKNSGRYYSSTGNITIKSNKNSGGYFLFPDINNKVLGKRKFFARYAIQDLPNNGAGYLGSAVGVTIENNKITNGLFILTGVKQNKKKQEIDLIIKQIYTQNGQTTIEDIVSREDLDFEGTTLFEGDDLLEVYIEFNADMNRMKLFIGSTSIFSKNKKPSDKDNKKPSVIPVSTEIKSIKKGGTFGFVALQNVVGTLDDMAFTRKSDPRDLNTISINNNDSDYQGDKDSKVGSGFYIGPNGLLSQIALGQFISGFDHFKDGFVFTGAPVARGIKLYEVDYDIYPIISQPTLIFPGYSYEESLANTSVILGANNV